MHHEQDRNGIEQGTRHDSRRPVRDDDQIRMKRAISLPRKEDVKKRGEERIRKKEGSPRACIDRNPVVLKHLHATRELLFRNDDPRLDIMFLMKSKHSLQERERSPECIIFRNDQNPHEL